MHAAATPERPTARPDVALRRVGSEWVLFDPGTDRAHVLNPTAAIIWSFCDGDHDPGAIVEAIVSEVPSADPAQVRRDVGVALRRFAAEGLLR